jgi:hypothetical protein
MGKQLIIWKKGVPGVSKNLDNIKNKSTAARQRLEGTYGLGIAKDGLQARAELASLFSEVASSRQKVSDSLVGLLRLRVSAYESAISGYISNYYAVQMSRSMASVDILFRALELVTSSDFTSEFDSAVHVIENGFNPDRLERLANYFSSTFAELASIALPDDTVSFTISNGLRVNGSAVSPEPQENENKLYLMLEVLGKLSMIREEDLWDDISSYKSFSSQESEGSFPSLVKTNISARLGLISDIISSKKFMDALRADRDANYSPEDEAGVNSAMEKARELLPVLTDLDPSGLSLARSNGTYDGLASSITEMLSKSEDLIIGSVSAISQLEDFIEDYQVFVRLPESESQSIFSAVSVCESAGQRYEQLGEQYQTGLFVSPFLTGSEDGIRQSFTEWTSELTGGGKIDGSVFEMILLYMGTVGRDFLNERCYLAFSNRAFTSIRRKSLVSSDQIDGDFKSAKESEQVLLGESGVLVVENPWDEPTPFGLKAILPDTEVLDYVSFEPVFWLNSSNSGLSAAEVSFRNYVRLSIMESFGKVRKEELASKIIDAISAVSSWKRENLKGLYIEICFREAIDRFRDYLDGLVSFQDETRIDTTTMEAIEAYLDSDPQAETLEGWVEDYVSIHGILYGSGASGDILSDALLDGSEVKEKLLG